MVESIDVRERRVFGASFELRAADDDSPATLKGYAALFNKRSSDLGGFFEEISPGAFADTLDGDVRALFNHDPNIVLGRTKSGTLDLSEDKRGLAFELRPPDTTLVADQVLAPIQRGDVSQMSFGFITLDDEWRTEGKTEIRTLIKVELLDISPVTFPAYPQTKVAVRSLEVWRESQPESVAQRELEEIRLRDGLI